MIRNFFFLFGLKADKVRHIGKLLHKLTTFVGNNYSIWKMKSKDELVFVLIHEDDDEIAAVIDTDGKFLYLHPSTRNGAKLLLNMKTEGGRN